MRLTRRDVMAALGAGLAAGPVVAHALPVEPDAQEVIAAFVGDAPVTSDGITLIMPDLAEDGYRVLAEIDAPGAEEVLLVAPANPVKAVVSVRFGPVAATQRVSTRVRMGDSQEVVALARMPDGTIRKTTHKIEVMVGGCA